MKLYSDKLAADDLYRACKVAGPMVKIDELDTLRRPRLRRYGWEVKLTGSSPFNGQGRYVKAATYDEHGLWIAELYRLDPDMIVSTYRNAEDFERKTSGKYPVAA